MKHADNRPRGISSKVKYWAVKQASRLVHEPRTLLAPAPGPGMMKGDDRIAIRGVIEQQLLEMLAQVRIVGEAIIKIGCSEFLQCVVVPEMGQPGTPRLGVRDHADQPIALEAI